MIKRMLGAIVAPFLLVSPVLAEPQYAVASWYGPGFHGRTTANGEVYDQNGLSVAHRRMRFGTRLRICYPVTGRCVEATVNDRGPFIPGRTFDLSKGAADVIGLTPVGVDTITFEVL